MKINVILPHTQLYGGVKRFMELGNLFIEKGHTFTIFTEEGRAPTWFSFKGEVKTYEQLESSDVLFFTDPNLYPLVKKTPAKRKVFYFVKGHEDLKEMIADGVSIFANSTNMYNEAKRKYGVKAFKAFGGINLNLYNSPKPLTARDKKAPFVIIAYGRLTKRNKGTKYVVKACERIYKQNKNIKLILFDTPQDEEMVEAIKNFQTTVPFEFILNNPIDQNHAMFKRADVFISAERKAGWANTSVEALASGIPIIATKSGTKDFLIHKKTGLVVHRNKISIAKAIKKIIKDDTLRLEMAKAGRLKIEEFNWTILAQKIETYLTETNVKKTPKL